MRVCVCVCVCVCQQDTSAYTLHMCAPERTTYKELFAVVVFLTHAVLTTNNYTQVGQFGNCRSLDHWEAIRRQKKKKEEEARMQFKKKGTFAFD